MKSDASEKKQRTTSDWLLAVLVVTCFLFSALTVFDLIQTRSGGAHAQGVLDSWLSSFKDFLFPYQESPRSLKLSTFYPPTPTITPTYVPQPTVPPGQPTPTQSWTTTPVPTVPGGGPPADGKQYCVDEEPTSVKIEACDDATRCDIAHGDGGPSSTCGRVIGWEHLIIPSLLKNGDPTTQYGWQLTDSFPGKASTCHAAPPQQPYISNFNVSDAYNLAGFLQFTRNTHIDVPALLAGWRATAGYTTSTSVQGVTPGDAIFFSNPPHAGIVNTVEVDANGNGSMWFLHSEAGYYLGKLFVANWSVVESSTGDTAVTFGSNTSKGPDVTRGSTICYCGSICYEWHFPTP